MDNQDVIATLNDLLEISRDGEQGFRTCAEGVRTPNLKALLETAARHYAHASCCLVIKFDCTLHAIPPRSRLRRDSSQVNQPLLVSRCRLLSSGSDSPFPRYSEAEHSWSGANYRRLIPSQSQHHHSLPP
jgi:Domain of unknown function (DUF2383)